METFINVAALGRLRGVDPSQHYPPTSPSYGFAPYNDAVHLANSSSSQAL